MESRLITALRTAQELAGLPLDELERRAQGGEGRTLALREWVALAEAWRIARALEEASGNRSAAARALGIGRRTLYTKLERLGAPPPPEAATQVGPDLSG